MKFCWFIKKSYKFVNPKGIKGHWWFIRNLPGATYTFYKCWFKDWRREYAHKFKNRFR